MLRFLQAVAFALGLFACAAARANVGETPVFVFDTRDSNATHYADSAAFALDTRSSNSTHYNESAVFVLNTRAFDGLGGYSRSGTFVLDTRATLADGITLAGPASVTTGSTTEYQVAFRSGNTTTDVTTQCTLAFTGTAPVWAGVGGTSLFVNRNAPASTLTLRAIWRPPSGGQYLSGPKTVAVGNILRAGMTATPQPVSGPNYTVNLAGTAAGGLPFYTFRWDTNGDGIYGDKIGSVSNFPVVDAVGGYHAVNLEVIDGNGNKAYAKGGVTIDRAPVVNEPVRTKPPIGDVGSGDIYRVGLDGNGLEDFAFETARIPNGFVLITHGLYSKVPGWPEDMAKRIQTRTGGAKPNIALYDWRDDADPGGKVDATKLAALEKLELLLVVGGLVPAAKAGLGVLAEEAAKAAAEEIVEAGIEEALGINLSPSVFLANASDFIIDASWVRPIGKAHGIILASWIWLQANAGLIDPDQPIHLIAHSAGGFAVGECAAFLKQHPLSNGKTVQVDRVTMLDTPFPYSDHLKSLPEPGTVERFTSSYYGGIEWPNTWLTSSPYLRERYLGWWWRKFSTGDGGHGLAHRWYRWTIDPQDGEEDDLGGFGEQGFSLSPIINPATRIDHSSGSTAAAKLERPASPASAGGNALTGFTAFGNVLETGGTFTLTEQANAGITKPQTIPVGTEALKFRFQFTTAGDGDYLEVRFGDDFPLYLALDTVLTRNGFTEVEAPIERLDGMTKMLTFTLVSRGAANAVVQLRDICLVTAADPDGDGLTTAQETALGTNPLAEDTDGDGLADGAEVTLGTSPLLWDSDGDGLGDGAEVAAGTSALDASSTFAVKETVLNPDRTITIVWEAQAGRTYRVLRSLEPDFPEFDVIASGIVPAVPLTSFTDTAIDTATTAKVFYRVQVE